MSIPLWSDWSHTANSIETRGGNWQFSFSIADLAGGVFAGVVPGNAAPVFPHQAWFGLRIEKLQSAVVRVSVVARNPLTGVNAVVSSTVTGATEFHIAHFQGQIYLTAGGGTRLAADGSTEIQGATLLGQYESRYSGATRLVAAFLVPGDSLTDYQWDALGASEAVINIRRVTAASSITITLPSDPALGDTVTITASDGAVTVEGAGTDTIDGSGDDYVIPDGGTVEFEWDGSTWVPTEDNDNPVESGLVLTNNTDLDTLGLIAQASLAFSPFEVLATASALGTPVAQVAVGNLTMAPFQVSAYEDDPTLGTLNGAIVFLQLTASGTLQDISVRGIQTFTGWQVLAADANYNRAFLNMAPFTLSAGAGATEPAATPYFNVLLGNTFASNATIAAALEKITAYAEDNTNPAPTVQDYADAGVVGVTQDNLADVNAAIDAVPGAAADTVEKVQAIVDAVLGVGSELVFVSESIFAASETQSLYNIPILERVLLSSPVQTFYQTAVELLDSAGATPSVELAVVTFITETYNVSDTITYRQALQIAEALVAEGRVETVYHGIAAVVSAILVGDDGAIAAYSKSVSDAVEVVDAANYLFQMLAVLTDGVGAADTLQNVLAITVLETAEVEVDDTLELSAQYFGRLLDRVEVLAMIKTPAELAQGWVMNTEGSMPISEYDNYSFNSLAYSPDEMLGCTDQGLYILDGEDDAGTDIDAQLTSLMLDFGTSKLKRMSTAYLGYRSDGQLLLKVRSVEQGVHAERWYEARSTAAKASPGQNRMKIGKGLRSRYWTFELVNVEGSDFELDKVELYPIVLDRRI